MCGGLVKRNILLAHQQIQIKNMGVEIAIVRISLKTFYNLKVRLVADL